MTYRVIVHQKYTTNRTFVGCLAWKQSSLPRAPESEFIVLPRFQGIFRPTTDTRNRGMAVLATQLLPLLSQQPSAAGPRTA